MTNKSPKKNNFGNLIQPLTIIKATAWVIFGISNLFSVDNLKVTQSSDYWVTPFIKFGLAFAFLFVGVLFHKDHKKFINILFFVLLLDIFVCVQPTIGLFDILMLLFDGFLFWFLFNLLKAEKI